MGWLSKNSHSIIMIAVFSAAAFAVSFVLSMDLVHKIAPITTYSSEYSYWTAWNVHSPIWDIWFDSDPQIVLANLTQAEQGHYSLYKHPIFSLMFFPVVWVLRQLSGGDVYMAIRLFSAANAFLSMALLGALARRMKLDLVDTALCCLVFLVSSTMFFWYTIPEKFPLGATAFLVALHVALSATPKTFWGYVGHILMSALMLAITVTNWVVGLLTTAAVFGLFDRPAATISRWRQNWRSMWADLKLPIALTIIAFAITAILAAIQDPFFGHSSLFFNVLHYYREGEYALEYLVTPAWMRPVSIFTSPIVMGTIETWHSGARITGDNITPSTWAGWIAMLLWAFLLLRGFVVTSRLIFNAQTEAEILLRRMLIVVLLTLVAFTALHSVYGYVTFLYMAHLPPFLLVIFASNFVARGTTLLRFDTTVVLRTMALVLVVAAAINNYDLLQHSIAFVDERIMLGIEQQYPS